MEMARVIQFIASGAGLALAMLATAIELRHEEDPDYVAVCDLTETVSCSKVMSSEYGHMLSLLGIVPRGSSLDRSNAEFG
jgi:vitamin-K-epoxide reductase (warfarin-sensitive)